MRKILSASRWRRSALGLTAGSAFAEEAHNAAEPTHFPIKQAEA